LANAAHLNKSPDLSSATTIKKFTFSKFTLGVGEEAMSSAFDYLAKNLDAAFTSQLVSPDRYLRPASTFPPSIMGE